MELPQIDYEILLPEHASPEDPITIFTLYYTPQMIDCIVDATNEHPREPADPSRPRARAHSWYPTCPAEIYIYFAIRIYSTLYPETEIADYWDTRTNTPNHPISAYMARDRF